MRDLAELEARVRDPDSRPHFQEAVRAFQAGAHRAAVVEAWVAVSLDLTNKIRHLGETGDGTARTAIQHLDAAIEGREIPKMQEFERTLLEQSEGTFELITLREHAELKRLYDDRNLCAHPTFTKPGEVFSPSPELVRNHLATAVDCVLSLPPVSGKTIVDNLQRDLDSNSWPRDADVVGYLREQYFTRTRDSVRLNLAKLLVKCGVRPPATTELDVVGPNQLAYRCRTGINALYEFEPALLEQAIATVVTNWERSGALSDGDLVRLTGALGHLPVLWRTVARSTHSRVAAILESAPVDTLIAERAFSSGRPTDPALAGPYDEAIKAATENFEDLERLVRQPTLDRRQWVAPALEALENAGSFRSAESRLRCLLRLAGVLTVDDLEAAASSIRSNNQIYQASDTPELLSNLYQETAQVPGAVAVWRELAQGLHDDYMADHTDPDGYYSYSELVAEMGPAQL